MARVHNQLSYGTDISSAAARLAGLDDLEEGVARLGETLQPICNPWERAEWAFLRGELLVSGDREQAAAGATTFAFISCSVPPTGNLIMVIERAFCIASAAGQSISFSLQLDSQLDADELSTMLPLLRRDRRGAPVLGRTFTRRGAPAAAYANSIEVQRSVSANDPIVCQSTPVVLTPGIGFAMQTNSANVALRGTFIGYERVALPGEL